MIYKYLLEIKYRTFFSFIAWSFLTINCYFFKETLLYLFLKFNSVYHYNFIDHFLVTDVTEIFITYLQLSYFITNQITIIFVCYQFFIFFSTGFYKFEYLYFKNVSLIILTCWFFFVFESNYFPCKLTFFPEIPKFNILFWS